MFKIITKGWNCEKYIEKCIKSVKDQTVTNWDMTIIIDPCYDESFNIAKKYESDKIKVYTNEKRRFCAYNIYQAVEKSKSNDEDILVFLDADDRFAVKQTLQVVQDSYSCNPNVLITYGNFKNKHELNGYSKDDFKIGIRKILLENWQASHLKTMKYKLWKRINKDTFKKSNGKWLKYADDMAFMIAGLEMAGYTRSRFIKQKIYYYNWKNVYNTEKIDPTEQDECAIEVYNQEKYKLLGDI